MKYDESVYRRFMFYVQVCNHGVTCTECCWPWMGAGGQRGKHGRFWNGKSEIGAHIFMWEWEHGPILYPDVCHSCDYPPCVQPAHLWNGTRAQNIQDSWQKGRSFRLRGPASPNAKLSLFDYHLLFALRRQGEPQWCVGQRLKISQMRVSEIERDPYWKYLRSPE